MEKKFTAIAVFGEYDCKDAVDSTIQEIHTAEEWKKIFEKKNCYVEVHRFRTEAERDAFALGIERLDNWNSDDFYTCVVLKDRIIESTND